MTSSSKSKTFTLPYFLSFIKFSIVGLIGVGVNEGLLVVLQSKGFYVLYAGAAAIEVSILSNFFLNDLWTFRDRRSGHIAIRLVKFNLLMLAGLVANLAILYVGNTYFGIAAALANLIGIGAAFLLRYVLSVKYAWMSEENLERLEGGPATPVPGPLVDQQNA